jgi:hypothetical protein
MQRRSCRHRDNRGNSLQAGNIEAFRQTDQFYSGTESTGIGVLAEIRIDENTHNRRLDKPTRVTDGIKECESL